MRILLALALSLSGCATYHIPKTEVRVLKRGPLIDNSYAVSLSNGGSVRCEDNAVRNLPLHREGAKYEERAFDPVFVVVCHPEKDFIQVRDGHSNEFLRQSNQTFHNGLIATLGFTLLAGASLGFFMVAHSTGIIDRDPLRREDNFNNRTTPERR